MTFPQVRGGLVATRRSTARTSPQALRTVGFGRDPPLTWAFSVGDRWQDMSVCGRSADYLRTEIRKAVSGPGATTQPPARALDPEGLFRTMFKNLLSRLVNRGQEPKLFTAEQLAETFKHAYRAGQAAGPAEPVVHRSWADIIGEAEAERSAGVSDETPAPVEAERADRAVVLPLAGRR